MVRDGFVIAAVTTFRSLAVWAFACDLSAIIIHAKVPFDDFDVLRLFAGSALLVIAFWRGAIFPARGENGQTSS